MKNYFYILFFLNLIIDTGFLHGQAQAQDQAKIVAVGEASKVKDKILFDFYVCAKSNPNLAVAKEIREIMRNDFSFYRHIYSIFTSDQESSFAGLVDSKYQALNSDQVFYWIALTCDGSKLNLVAFNVRERKEIFRQVISNPSSDRSFVHKLSDGLFKAIAKRNSVFLSKVVFSAAEVWGPRKSMKEIYTMDFDGFNMKKITNHKGIAISPAFSPDNNKIIYSLIDSKSRIKNVALHEFNLLTGKSIKVSDKVGINSGAIYTSDGRGVYFTLSYRGNADIYHLDLGTKLERQITNNRAEDVDPSITSDGRLLTFLSNRPGNAHVYTLNPSGMESQVNRVSFVGQFNATPRFSPDGKEIIFSSWVDQGFDLYRLSISGNSLIRLTKNFGSNEDPSFSPDGEFIVFTSKRNGRGVDPDQKIYIMNRDGDILGALTPKMPLCTSPRFSN